MAFPSTTVVDKRPNIFFATLAQDLNEGGSETEIFLSTITTLDGTVLTSADISFFGRCILTIAPQSSTQIEFAEFLGFSTPDTSVTGVTRGLSFNSNDIIPANVKFHATGTPVIISFGTHDFIDIQDALVTLLNLIDSAVVSGAALASNTVIGISELTAAPGYIVGTCTISIASPAVITAASHGLSIGNVVSFSTTGSLPTGIVAGTKYYIISAGFTTNSFEIAATPNGTAINTSGTQSGTQTLTNATPIAVGLNDNRLSPVSLATLTAGMVAALAGDNGTPGAGNTFTTQSGLQHNAEKYAADAGSTDDYVITLSPVPSSYTSGMMIYFKANTVNTGAATLNVNSLGAKTIVKYVNTTLNSGDIAAGMFCTVIYDGTNFVLQNPIANVAPMYVNGATTYDASTASGTQNIAHGLGRVPKYVRIKAIYAVATTTIGVPLTAETVYNGTTQSSLSVYPVAANSLNFTTTFSLNSSTVSGNHADGVVTFDATNIIITWTKTGSPTGVYDLMWEAEA